MRGRNRVLRKIEALDPLKDHERIVYLSAAYDFPFDSQRALELALIRTFAVPRSSELMVRTEEFTRRTQKRYDDTTILVSTIGLHGYSSEAGRRAIRRMNQIHRRYAIPNDEFVYVLSTFVLEPIRWNARYGWRPLSDHEKRSLYLFWREVGRRMAIANIPEDLEALEHWSRAYERLHFAYSRHNQLLAEAVVELFLGWVLPKALWPLGRPLVLAVMDEPMQEAFGFTRPPRWAYAVVNVALGIRKRLLRLLPPRRTPHTLPPPRSYPEGYRLEEIGPQH